MEIVIVSVLARVFLESLRLEHDARRGGDPDASRVTRFVARAFALVSAAGMIVFSAAHYWPRTGGPEPW